MSRDGMVMVMAMAMIGSVSGWDGDGVMVPEIDVFLLMFVLCHRC